MSTTKPDCKDFIVAAVRMLRTKKKNMKPGTAAGISLNRLSEITCQEYSDEEFVQTLEKLVREGVVTVIASGKHGLSQHCNEFADSSGKSSTFTVERFPLPSQLSSLRYTHWYIDDEGRGVGKRELAGDDFSSVWSPTVYVKADGLPDGRKAKRNERNIAKEIMASLTKQ